VIRRARPDDADAIAELYEPSFAKLTFMPVLHTLAEHRTWFRRVLAQDEVWVHEEDGRVLGFAALSERRLDYLYVEPSASGRGIGSGLLEHAKARRPRGFTLWAFRENDSARRFYERHGLRAIAFGDGSSNEEGLPDVQYEWRASAGRERAT
jgi:GNAT superfamily N-acetyltransferase